MLFYMRSYGRSISPPTAATAVDVTTGTANTNTNAPNKTHQQQYFPYNTGAVRIATARQPVKLLLP